MIILTIRTDKPEAELSLYDTEKSTDTPVAQEMWQAHRELAETIHKKIDELYSRASYLVHDTGGIVAFQGPGSFTGLRIGLSLANALADGLQIPIVATQSDEWRTHGITRLLAGENDTVALPEYGAPVHITQQKR